MESALFFGSLEFLSDTNNFITNLLRVGGISKQFDKLTKNSTNGETFYIHSLFFYKLVLFHLFYFAE